LMHYYAKITHLCARLAKVRKVVSSDWVKHFQLTIDRHRNQLLKYTLLSLKRSKRN
jgi:hypothetical protein